MKSDDVNVLIDASNEGISCSSLAMFCTICPGIFRAKKPGKVGFSFVSKNLRQEVSLAKMTPFIPRGLTQWRTHCTLAVVFLV